ncbi:MAG: hypothetical protein JWP89_3440 [Schlesneria sp.]|nr:hypothetical protein [Schlesneria sp.]
MRFDVSMKTLLIVIGLLPVSQLAAEDGPQGNATRPAEVVRLERAVQQELDQGYVNGVSIALIDDSRIVYAHGFGYSNRDHKTPATAKSIYRAGSISKLVTAVAAMKLREQTPIDLDAPIQTYLPDFRIVNPYPDAPAITLRRLLCHRSGMIRESPVGGYFDDQEPTLDAVVASLSDCVLPSAPEAKTRYSNVGPTIAGKTIETLSRQTFEDFVQKQVFDVAGMSSSSWKLQERQRDQMSAGYLSVALPNGGFQQILAPRFELGTVPAGNLYTTVEDLGRFIMFLVNEGRVGDRILVQPETLAEMYKPQGSNAARTFGLGFSLGKHQEHETVQHMGAVYGFTSSLIAIPSQKVGAVVLANEDLAIGSVQRMMAAAIEAALACRQLPAEAVAVPSENLTLATSAPPALSPRTDLRQFVGKYESTNCWAEFTEKNGQLQAVISGQPVPLESRGDLVFVANSRFFFNSSIAFERNDVGEVIGCTAMRQKFSKLPDSQPQSEPANWTKFVGTYGPAFIPLIISIRNGHLYAMTENEMDYRLAPINRTVFRFPAGMYDDEHLIFQQGEDGRVHSVIMANFVLKRSVPSQAE